MTDSLGLALLQGPKKKKHKERLYNSQHSYFHTFKNRSFKSKSYFTHYTDA